MKQLIKRIYHPYWLWEEVRHNMWGESEDETTALNKVVEFTGNHKKYGKYMMKVARKWKYSCEHNLSNLEQNRQAWIGHAAVAFAMGVPEDIVRRAWWMLSDKQRELANKEADNAISYWEKNIYGKE